MATSDFFLTNDDLCRTWKEDNGLDEYSPQHSFHSGSCVDDYMARLSSLHVSNFGGVGLLWCLVKHETD
jgi:hypothetical protein